MKAVRLVTVSGDAEREALLAGQLDEHSEVELVLRCVDRSEVLGAAGAGDLDGVLAVGLPGWLDRPTVRELHARRCRLIGLVDHLDEANRLESLGAIVLPSTTSAAEIARAVAAGEESPHAQEEIDRPAQSSPRGRLIAVWGPKGSPGRTAVSIEVATLLAQVEPRTILIDGDPYGGDALQLLGIVEELPTIVWAARMAEKQELEGTELVVELRRAARRGPILLPGLPRAELWAEISDQGWRSLLDIARGHFDFVICDTGFCLEPERIPYNASRVSRNGLARLALSEADHVVAVVRADPMGLRRFLWSFDELKELVDPEKVTILLNRCRKGDAREAKQVIHKHLDKRVAVTIPDKPREFERAVARGRPVLSGQTRSDLADPFRQLACILGGRLPAAGFLARLRKGTAA